MDMQEFIDSLNLPFKGKMKGSNYIIDLDNSNDFSKLYNIIATDKQFTVADDSMATKANAMFVFNSEWYEIKFTADFDEDIYRMVVSDR